MPLCIISNVSSHTIFKQGLFFTDQISIKTINGVVKVNSLNIGNLANTIVVSMNPSGTYLYAISSSGSLVCNIDFNNAYNTTLFNTSSTSLTSYGGITNLVVTNSRVYILGGYTSINENTLLSAITYANHGNTTIYPMFTTTYQARYVYNGIFDNSNNVFFTAENFYSPGPTDSFYNGINNNQIYFENGNSSQLTSLSKYLSNTATNGIYTINFNNERNSICFDAYRANIFMLSQAYDGNFPPLRHGWYNCISKFNLATNSLSLFATLTTIDTYYPTNNTGLGQNIMASYNYVYAAITNSNPVTTTDGLNFNCNYIMSVNINTSNIIAMGKGLNGVPYAMAYDASRNYLYVGGAFTTAAGFPVGYTAYWDENEQTWNNLVTLNGTCLSLAYSPTYNLLFFSGNFTSINGKTCNGFASFYTGDLQFNLLNNFIITLSNIAYNNNRIACSTDGKYITFVCNLAIFVSSNYGTSFTKVTVTENMITISMSSTGQYQLATSNGEIASTFYNSTNYGVTWTRKFVSATNSTKYMSCCCVSSTGQYQYIGGAGGNSAYYSINYGSTYLVDQSVLSYSSSKYTAIFVLSNVALTTIGYRSGSTSTLPFVYADLRSPILNNVVEHTWSIYNDSIFYDIGFKVTIMACKDNIIFVTNTGVTSTNLSDCRGMISLNGNIFGVSSWTAPFQLPDFFYNAIFSSKGIIWAHTFSKIYYSSTNGLSWNKINTYLTDIHSFCISYDGNIMYLLTSSGSVYQASIVDY